MADSPVVSTRWLTIPNVLSFARLASVPVFVLLFVNGHEGPAVAVYAVGALTDFFDGYIARRFDQTSELGQLLDPLADRVFIVALAIALVAHGTMPLALALAVIVRDVLILGLFAVFERRGMERIAVNNAGKSATALLLFGLSCLALSETSVGPQRAAEEVGLFCAWFGAVMYWIAAAQYLLVVREQLSTKAGEAK